METTSHDFPAQARRALGDATLQQALGNIKTGFVGKRRQAVEALPEFEALRHAGQAIKDHTLAHLDLYLEQYEQAVISQGGVVHWAEDAAEACRIVLDLCRSAGARLVTKGKSMVAEEIGLNAHLEANGLAVVETDLGEYIIQLRHEAPSHIIAPATHVLRGQVEATFRAAHTDLPADRPLAEPRQLTDEARDVLRSRFAAAEVGITGANFLIAETGSSIIVTNEGNGDLTQTLATLHVVIASLEKIVPTLEDAATLLRLLTRSATGQEASSYMTVSTGPRRPEDVDGPAQYHVVLVDNGRSRLLGTEFRPMLRCIRCAACMNHCPVYGAVGGHAYGSVYPGPMGAVLTPSLAGIGEAGHLPNASTFCGKCESVCPVRIPLPQLMRHWREREWRQRLNPPRARLALRLWAFAARRPMLYGLAAGLAVRLLGRLGRRGRFARLPLAGGWTEYRDFPAPEGRSFQSLWAERRR